MKAEYFSVRQFELSGWPVRIKSYKVGETWYAKADNVSPGATIATASGGSQWEAEATVTEKARKRLSATRRFS